MARPLPLMDYSDMLAYEGGPLRVQAMPTSLPQTNVPTMPPYNFGYDPAVVPPPNFASPDVQPNNIQDACSILRSYDDYYRSLGVNMNTFYNSATSRLRDTGFLNGNQTYQNTCRKSPFENEIIQYGLLFLLAYVVIKKL